MSTTLEPKCSCLKSSAYVLTLLFHRIFQFCIAPFSWAFLSVSHPSSLQMALGVTGMCGESAVAHDHTGNTTGLLGSSGGSSSSSPNSSHPSLFSQIHSSSTEPQPRKLWAVVASTQVPGSHSWEVCPGGAHMSMVGKRERSPGTPRGSCFSTALNHPAKEYAPGFSLL